MSLFLISLALASGAFAQDKRAGKAPPKEYSDEELLKMSMKAKVKPPPPLGFKISPADHDPALFTLLLSDSSGRFVSSSFPMANLSILSAILKEAKNFSLTAEGVGAGKPLVTRFFDKQLPAVIVDVAKAGDTSRFFITLKGLNEAVTIDAGALKRSEKKPNPYYFEILTRVESATDGKWQ
jgi:hypothetical protein